jgi:NAD(P)-dependent dehydrogenase (short-subunit alcohol dehydrogenase family)
MFAPLRTTSSRRAIAVCKFSWTRLPEFGDLPGSAGIYCFTKFAVEGITQALAKELAPFGIFATTVEPGYFRTNFLYGISLVRVKKIMEDDAGPPALCAKMPPRSAIIDRPIPMKLGAASCDWFCDFDVV